MIYRSEPVLDRTENCNTEILWIGRMDWMIQKIAVQVIVNRPTRSPLKNLDQVDSINKMLTIQKKKKN